MGLHLGCEMLFIALVHGRHFNRLERVLADQSLRLGAPKAWMCQGDGRKVVRKNIVVDGKLGVEVEVKVGAKVVEDPGANRQDDLKV